MGIIYFVYILTFSNNKIYIGMSKTNKKGEFTNRFYQHEYSARSGKKLPIYSAWRKYGAPVQSIISTHGTRQECAIAEIDAIEKYDSTNPKNGYNILKGGQGQDSATNPVMYALMRERVWNNPEWKAKVSASLKGRKPSENTTKAYLQWCKDNPEKKSESARIAWRRPEYKKAKSESTRLQMANGGAELLKIKFKGRKDPRTEKGKDIHREKIKAWSASDEGQECLKRNAATTWSNEENRKKILEGFEAWRKSDRNKAHCKEMAKLAANACRRKVQDTATGVIYDSQKACAEALGVSMATISHRVKDGKIKRI